MVINGNALSDFPVTRTGFQERVWFFQSAGETTWKDSCPERVLLWGRNKDTGSRSLGKVRHEADPS